MGGRPIKYEQPRADLHLPLDRDLKQRLVAHVNRTRPGVGGLSEYVAEAIAEKLAREAED
jgi:hypothetical protein